MENKRLAQVMDFLGEEGIARSVEMNLQMEMKLIAQIEPMLLECLSFFECKKCGECCRDCPVQVTEEELMALLKRDGEKVFDMLDENVVAGNALKAPCGYLKDNACGIYDIKPLVCRVYPFTLKYPHFLAICLCPMGIEILNELRNCINEYKQRKNIRALSAAQEQMLKQAYELGQDMSREFFDDVGYKRGRMMDQAYFPYTAIPLFLKYLKFQKLNKERFNIYFHIMTIMIFKRIPTIITPY